MEKMRLVFLSILVLSLIGIIQAQGPVLIAQYEDPSYYDAAEYGGQRGIYFDPATGYIATGMQTNRSSLHSIVSLDGGLSWQTTSDINSGGEVRQFTIIGDSNSPIYLFSKRNDGTNSAPPWARHRSYIAIDDFGWGGGSYSISPVATAGDSLDVLDSYTANMDISAFDPNLRGVMSHHGSSQAGGEYQKFFGSVDGGQTWVNRIRVVSSADEDTLNPNYVADLTYNTADIHYGPDGYILAAGTAQFDFDFEAAEHLWYSFSVDSGQTWSPVTLVPGSEWIDVDWNKVDRGYNLLLDANNDFHLFALAKDTSGVYGSFDFIWDGSSWTMQKFLESQYYDDGLVAIESDHGDNGPLNVPTLNTDGTIFYSFIDLVDTTGGVNDYQMFMVYSNDNGLSWSSPVQLITDPGFHADKITDVAREADGALHVMYTLVDTVGVDTVNQYYQKVDVQQYTSIDDRELLLPEQYTLYQNFPNPFNPVTKIRFNIQRETQVTLTVYNVVGEKVATLIENAQVEAGMQQVEWQASDFASGVYFYRLQMNDGHMLSRKMLLLK